METKRITVPFEVKQAGEEQDGFFHIRGLASTYDVDLGDDEIVPGAFSDTILDAKNKAVAIEGTQFKALIPSLWQHSHKEPTGSYVELEEVQEGLMVHSIHPLDDDFVRGRVKPQVKVGSVRKMSIGYGAKKFSYREEAGRRIRTLEVIDLGEISLVTFPMNTGASIISAKAATSFGDLPLADVARPWSASEARGRVRQFLDSVDEPSSKYRRAFFWFDSEDAENFGAYKMPYADVIDGRLTAVPRGIFAAAASFSGARTPLKIPEADREAVRNHINRYYGKMDRESPLKEKTLVVDAIDVKYLTERELEGILSLESVKFSTQASKTLISCLNVKALRDAGRDVARDAEKDSELVEAKLDTIIDLLEK